MYTYPSPTDNLPAFVALLGGFWTELYGGADLVYDYLRAGLLPWAQQHSDLNELAATLSRHTCPTHHDEQWHALTLREADRVLLPDGQAIFPFPRDLREVHYAADRITRPANAWTQGVDFTINPDQERITFLDDPFLAENLPIEGDAPERTFTLWLLHAKFERNCLYQNYGYVLGLERPSSHRYKDLLVAGLNAVTGVASYADVAAIVEAVAGVPRCRTDGEIVQVVTADANHKLIITDRNVYAFAPTATPIVAVDQKLRRDDQLIDAVQIFEPSGGRVPQLPSLTLPAELFDPQITGPLTFDNLDAPLTVTENVGGYTKISWPLGGAAADVSAFFDQLHARGVAAGATLANYLDTRPQPQPTQPAAVNLPVTINPLAFLFRRVLRGNCLLIRLKQADFGPDALGADYLSLLRRIVPPHVLIWTVLL